jgi:hypothetical protein
VAEDLLESLRVILQPGHLGDGSILPGVPHLHRVDDGERRLLVECLRTTRNGRSAWANGVGPGLTIGPPCGEGRQPPLRYLTADICPAVLGRTGKLTLTLAPAATSTFWLWVTSCPFSVQRARTS